MKPLMKLVRLVRRLVRAIVGELPARESLGMLRRAPSAARNWMTERAEVERLGSGRVVADIVTVIPTYRRPHLLPAAVRSALEQDVPNHAVIVVSDGAPIEAELPQDDRLTSVVLRRNTGVAGVVRNVGIRLSDSPYVAFLDDDNEWLPGHLADLVSQLDAGADLAYTGLIRVLPDGREFDRVVEPFDRAKLRHENYIDVNTVAIRRSRAVRFSRRRRRPLEIPGEDWAFAWRRSRRRSVVSIPRCSVRYLINPDSFFWPSFSDHARDHLDQIDEADDASDPARTVAPAQAGDAVIQVGERAADQP